MTPSALARYRPAILAVTAIAAGYSLYYYLEHSDYGRPPSLHRSNAIHRRRRNRASQHAQQSAAHDGENTERRVLNASQVLELLDLQFSAERPAEIAQTTPQGLASDDPETRPQVDFGSEPAPLHRFLRNVRVYDESSGRRSVYEAEVLHAFLIAQVGSTGSLYDPEGEEMYCTRLTRESPSQIIYFSSREAVLTAVRAFNSGTSLHPTSASINLGASGEAFSDLTPDDELAQEISQAVDVAGELTEEGSEQSWRGTEANEESRRDGQSLLNMLYHIAEDQSRRDGFIHRGVLCNSCGVTPIRGTRYRCSNCPDFDLCEQCESMQVHPKTHLFYKVRIPAPFLDSTRRPQPPRYPGKPSMSSNNLPRDTVKGLAKESGRELAEVEALWDQFKCLAASNWAEDPLEYKLAIDRDVFDKCFLPSPERRRRPSVLPFHDRIFAFFDTNGDGLIGFHEFVMGIATIRTTDKDAKLKRTFDCYDMDEDGLIRRKDLLLLFWSYYSLTKDLTEDALIHMEEDVMEGETLRETLQGSQPISATFTGSVPQSQHGVGRGKGRDQYGNPTIVDEGDILDNDNVDLGDENQVIGDVAELTTFGNILDEFDIAPIVRGSEHEHRLATIDWPPPVVRHEDVLAALRSDIEAVDVTDVYDRLKILQATSTRRDKARVEAIEKRRERQKFYDHEGKSPSSHSTEDVIGRRLNSNLGADCVSAPEERLAPTLEADAGQEYLYQILEECMNELLDPLFKPKEDLHLVAQLYFEDRKRLNHPAMVDYHTENFRKMCSAEVDAFLKDFRRSLPLSGGTIADATRSLWQWIERQHDPNEEQYRLAIADMYKYGVINEKLYNEINYVLQRRQGDHGSESDQSSSSVANSEAHQAPDETIIAPAAQRPEATESHLQASQHIERVIREIDDRDAASAEVANALESELSRGVHAYDNNDSSIVEEEIAQSELPDLLAEFGASTIDDSVGDATEDTIIVPPSHQSSSSFDNVATPLSEGFYQRDDAYSVRDSDIPDPTLPHTRPNAEPEGSDRSEWEVVSHVAPVSGDESATTREARVRWKHLMMLDCLAEEDSTRRGPGSLNYQEFYDAMKGPAGGKLAFLGMFYEMVLF